MDDILEFDFETYTCFYNTSNSKNICIPNQYLYLKKDFFEINNFFGNDNYGTFFPTTTICLNITSSCNLNCHYCFNKTKDSSFISYEDSIMFIEYVIGINPDSLRYVIDLSGSGEPLLKYDLIMKIADYALSLSDRLGKEVLVSFICNGTLLSKERAENLQKKKVLFGISLDGIKELHDKNRVFNNGKGTFDLIMKNYKAIENKTFIGAGMTFEANIYPPIFESYIFLNKHFETLSCRIARSSEIDKNSIEHIKKEYDRLTSFLIDDIYKNKSIVFLKKILNGDDYFGRFIIKTICDSSSEYRCDAGMNKYSLGTDKKVYICSPAVGIEELCIGEIDEIDFQKKSLVLKKEGGICKECLYKKICGGECKIVLYNNRNVPNKYICEYKQYLFYLALKLCGFIQVYEPQIYREIVSFVEEINRRSFGDEKLYQLYPFVKDIYTFTKLKEIKDNDFELFDAIYKNNVNNL